MNDRTNFILRLLYHDMVAFVARWILGGVFVYQGLSKAVHPVDFLKILREYHIVESHIVLNLIAAALPWFEVLCGLLLLGGIAVRGSALLLIGMLVPFTLGVLHRAMVIQAANPIPLRTGPASRAYSARLRDQSEEAATLSSTSRKPTLEVSLCPVIVSSPSPRAFFSRSMRGSMPRRSASRSIWLSQAKTTCGSPKPRKAPQGTLCVRTTRATP